MDIQCRTGLGPEETAAWQAFLARTPHGHPRQDPRFAPADRVAGRGPLFVSGERDGRIAAAALIGKRADGIAECLSGPVAGDAETLLAFLEALTASEAVAEALKDATALRITPYWFGAEAEALASELAAAGWTVSDSDPVRHTGMIDLGRSEDDIRASFSRSARRKVRLADKAEIEIRPAASIEEARLFFECHDDLARERGFSTVAAEGEALFEPVMQDPGIGVLLTAWKDGVFLGALQVYRGAETGHGRRYVTNPAANEMLGNLRIAPRLWLEGLLWSKAQGCTRFDVEGWREVEGENDPRFGVYTYKGEFKPEPAARIAEHEKVLAPMRHALATLPQKARRAVKAHMPGLARRLGRG